MEIENIMDLLNSPTDNFNKLEKIILDDNTYKELHGILRIISGRLKTNEIQKILENNIYILIGVAPASSLSNVKLPSNSEKSFVHYVTMDLTLRDAVGWSPEEFAAMLMHEFGHILNQCPLEEQRKDEYNKEYYPDDYARRNGFKTALLSGLEKYINSDLKWIDDKMIEQFQKRIERVKNENSQILKGEIKLLRV